MAASGIEQARLAGRKLLVTGAASGIGRACAQLFTEHGAQVVMTDVEADKLKEAARELRAAAIHADLRDRVATENLVSRAAREMDGLDGLINAAGVAILRPLSEMDFAVWNDVIAINLTAPYVICRAALPWLSARGGTVVNVASGAALVPTGSGTTAYAGSKGGLIAFTKALAAEFAPNVRANVVCPGLTQTAMTSSSFAGFEGREEQAPAVSRYALRRPAQPREIANVCLFLTSDESSFMTGATVAADGGRTFH